MVFLQFEILKKYFTSIILLTPIANFIFWTIEKEVAEKQLSKKELKKKEDEELAALLGGMGVDDKKANDK